MVDSNDPVAQKPAAIPASLKCAGRSRDIAEIKRMTEETVRQIERGNN